jgi:excisionase family DNA binding protein
MGEDRTNRGNTEGGSYQRRVTVSEAAELLGISEGAVRMRVKRGTLPSTREGSRLYVLLNTDHTTEQGRPRDRTHDRTSELIATLQEQLQAERQAHAEARRIIAGLVERIPALEPPEDTPPETRGSPTQAHTIPPEPETPAETRPWWRRVFGG